MSREWRSPQPGIRRTGRADGDRRHGYALRHLNDRQQRVEAVERCALNRYADDGQDGVRGHHAWEMRGAARARDNHVQAAAGRGRRVLDHPSRCPVR